MNQSQIAEISRELQALQKKRAWYMKTRNMIANRLLASVAGELGYRSGLEEKERQKLYKEARALIKEIEEGLDHDVAAMVLTTQDAIGGFELTKSKLEKTMVKLANQLPVIDWLEHTDQRGFGVLFLAIVIGETGDLNNYANPGKVWRRLGCAPFTSKGKTLMGATWRSKREGELSAAQWESFGYSQRRRSIAYLIGEGLIKQNKSIYRQRYDESKIRAAEKHPEWTQCQKCKGTGQNGRGNCGNCKGKGSVAKRVHLHGMLLASKMLLKNLWIAWHENTDGGEKLSETEIVAAPI